MKKLNGRDLINTYAVAKKVNEIIDFLEKNDIIREEDTTKDEVLTSK